MHPSTAWYSKGQPITAKYSQVQPGAAWYSQVQPNIAKFSQVQPSTAKYSQVQPSKAEYSQEHPSTTKYSLVRNFNFFPKPPTSEAGFGSQIFQSASPASSLYGQYPDIGWSCPILFRYHPHFPFDSNRCSSAI